MVEEIFENWHSKRLQIDSILPLSDNYSFTMVEEIEEMLCSTDFIISEIQSSEITERNFGEKKKKSMRIPGSPGFPVHVQNSMRIPGFPGFPES